MKRGDVVLMIMPGDLGKPRPGIVVQSDELGDNTTTVLVCPMSSDVQEPGLLRPIVEPSKENSLHVRSQIMTDKMLALRRERVRGVLGSIDATTRDQLDRALLLILGLAH